MALMLLHEWELRPDPEEEGPPARDPIDWRAQRWAFAAGLLFVLGLVAGGTAQLVLFWFALMVLVRRGWRAIDTGGGGLSEHRQ